MIKVSEKAKLWIYRAVVALFVLILFMVPQTEVRSAKINSRVIVEVIGIDKSGDEVEVSAIVSLPKSQEQQALKAASGKGETLSEAINDLDVSLGKSGALGLTTAVILGDGSFTEELEYLLTSTDVTAGVSVAAVSGSAKEFVGKLTEFMESAGLSDSSFLNDSARYSDVMPKTLVGFLSDFHSASKTALMPLYEFQTEEQSDGKSGGSGEEQSEGKSGSSGEEQSGGKSGGSGEEQSGGKGGGSGEEQSGGKGGGSGKEQSGGKGAEIKGLTITRLAAFFGDKTASVLSEEDSKAVALIASDERAGYFRTDLDFDGQNYKIIARIEHRSSSVSVKSADSASAQLSMMLQLINESEYSQLLTGKDGARFQAEVRKAFESEVQGMLEKAYAVTQAQGFDVFGFASCYYRTRPDESLDISNLTAKFTVSVKVR